VKEIDELQVIMPWCLDIASIDFARHADGTQIVVAAGARVFIYDVDGNPTHALKGHTV
jgi:hypothetical protein